MKASQKAINLIKQFEGCRLNAYKDGAGRLTIGYGHTSNVKEGQVITQSQAEAFLLIDIGKAEMSVNSYNGIYNFTQNEFDALTSFAFNIGNIKQLTSNGTRDKDTIAEKMLLYVNCNGIPLVGLENRRKAEYNLFMTKEESAIVNQSTNLLKVTFKDGYNIRKEPYTDSKNIIGNTRQHSGEFLEVFQIKDGYAETSLGWISLQGAINGTY